MNKDELLSKSYLTVAEVMDYLQISKSAAYQLCHRKDFPTCRVCSMIRIPTQEFLNWVDRHTRLIPEPPRQTPFSHVR